MQTWEVCPIDEFPGCLVRRFQLGRTPVAHWVWRARARAKVLQLFVIPIPMFESVRGLDFVSFELGNTVRSLF